MKSSDARFWAGLVLIVLLVRSAVLFFGAQGLKDDPDAYRAYAVSWARWGTFGLPDATGAIQPSAYRPPLYPWLLHLLGGSLEDGSRAQLVIGSLHLLLGLATCLLMVTVAGRLADKCLPKSSEAYRRFFVGLATLLVACDPILLNQSRLVMTETLATFLGLLGWWSWLMMLEPSPIADGNQQVQPVRGGIAWAFVSGLIAGLAVLCRPTAWPTVLGMLAVLLAMGVGAKLPAGRARYRLQLVAMTSGLMMLVAPWAIRNQQQLGSPVVMTTHGGFTLYLANNSSLYDHFRAGSYSRRWDPEPFHQLWQEQREAFQRAARVTEPQLDRYANQLATQTIVAQPGVFAKSCLARLGWLWAWWPQVDTAGIESRILIGCTYATQTLLGLVGLASLIGTRNWISPRQHWVSHWLAWWPALATILALSAVHAVYWSNMRMRAPAIPAVALLASLGTLQMVERIGRRRSKQRTVAK
ncbi:MAG: hypothetical protein ACK523_15610 [Pirellulaceae bacterium]